MLEFHDLKPASNTYLTQWPKECEIETKVNLFFYFLFPKVWFLFFFLKFRYMPYVYDSPHHLHHFLSHLPQSSPRHPHQHLHCKCLSIIYLFIVKIINFSQGQSFEVNSLLPTFEKGEKNVPLFPTSHQ